MANTQEDQVYETLRKLRATPQPAPALAPTEADIARWAQAQKDFTAQYTPPKVVDGPILDNPVDAAMQAGKAASGLFTFTNPAPSIQQAYETGGIGGVIGNRLRAGVEGIKGAMAVPESAQSFSNNITAGFTNQPAPVPPVIPNVVNSPPSSTQAPTPANTDNSRLPVVAGITTDASNTSGRAGFAPRRYYDSAGNLVASGISSAPTRGGFVGAATDAQAAKALQDRALQDQAASAMVARFDKQTEMLRDARAAQMGVSRGVLDRMENRDSSAAQADSRAQGAIPSSWNNPLALPGDSFQDTQARQAAYGQALDNAQTGNTKQRQAALGVLTGLNSLSAANQNAQLAADKPPVDPIKLNQFLLDQQRANYQQGLDENKFLLDRQKFDAQQELDRNRLQLSQGNLRNRDTAAALQQKKYDDERKASFMEKFSYPDAGAPVDQLGALTLSLSDATKGAIPPEVMVGYIQKAAKEAGVDWKNAPPKSLVDLGKRAMTLAVQDYQR